MFDNIIIFIAAAFGAGAVLALAIKFLLRLQDSTEEEIKQFENRTVDAIPRLPLQNEGAFGTKPINNNAVIIKTEGIKSPSEVLDMIEGVDKGILTVNDARKISDLKPVQYEPFINFQKAAHDFGDTTKAVNVGGSTIRRASNCPNCGANLTQNGVCAYCGTTYN